MTAFVKFILAVFFILLLVLAGTAGYMLIEGWPVLDSLYMTVITASTVGFKEVYPLSRVGKVFTIGFLAVSIITIGYTVTIIISYVFEGHALHTIKERKMKKLIGLMKDHYIICGFGDVGREAAEEFAQKKVPFIVIDNAFSGTDTERYPDYIFIEEDATEELVLEKARIDKARGLLSCLANDQLNVYTVLTARQMNTSLHIVAQAAENRTRGKLLTAGADRVILPKQIAGRRMATIATHPAIIDFLDILSTGGDDQVRIESAVVKDGSRLIGKSLKESQIGQDTGVIIIGILDGYGRSRVLKESSETLSSIRLKPDDQLIALGNEEQIIQLKKAISKS
ncbi:MAG: NAD-binding protein [Spirochaetales bacterium]|nr:NAD-binding protein [Spirochaetales bacterium]